jgi:TRAP-type C4-dicarboxylate transport system substrate-binding protein
LEDFKGLRLRFASPTVRDLVAALGATPAGVPPTEISEQLQKGTIDGTFIDYGGAGIAFRLGGIVKYSTELYAYVTSFGIGMNEDFWNRLPADLKKLVMDSVTGKEKEIGEAWDALDEPGKKLLMEAGGEAIKFSAADSAKVREIGKQVSEAKIKELEGKGLPARAVYDMMRELAEKHSKTSRTFWN